MLVVRFGFSGHFGCLMLVVWFGLGSVDSSFGCLMLVVRFGFSRHFGCLMLVVWFGLGSADNTQQTTDSRQQTTDSSILVIRMKQGDGWRSESSGNNS